MVGPIRSRRGHWNVLTVPQRGAYAAVALAAADTNNVIAVCVHCGGMHCLLASTCKLYNYIALTSWAARRQLNNSASCVVSLARPEAGPVPGSAAAKRATHEIDCKLQFRWHLTGGTR